MSTEKLFLLDGHALCYRSFFAIKGLATRQGQPTNAIFGFINTLRKILRDYKPKYFAICFDSKEKTHRAQKFTEYKIQRPKMPDDLISQMTIIKDIVRAYNLAIFESPGFEADDLIASLSQKVSHQHIDVVIVSDDKDLFQLASDRVKFLTTRQDNLLSYPDVKDQLGFEPEKIADFLALAGDKIDNIPGVHGIGEVTAINLIQRYGSLENILKNVDQISPAVEEKLKNHKNMAILSKELAILDVNAPIELNLDALKVGSPDNQRLFELFKEWSGLLFECG